jgi:hypothetical protein
MPFAIGIQVLLLAVDSDIYFNGQSIDESYRFNLKQNIDKHQKPVVLLSEN